MSKFCTKCGNVLKDDDVFCGKCGAKQTEINNQDMNSPETGTQGANLNQEQPQTTINKPESVFEQSTETVSNATSGNASTWNEGFPDVSNAPQVPQTGKKKNLLIPILVGVVVLFVIIGIILFSSRSSGKNEKSNSKNETTTESETSYVPTRISLTSFVDRYNSKIRYLAKASSSRKARDEEYVGAAKTLIDKVLKNPLTAQYLSEEVVENDDYGRAIVSLDVSAQNSFGGWVRQNFLVCINSMDYDGTFTYNPTLYYVDGYESYEMLKIMNHFGEDPVDVEVGHLYISMSDFKQSEEFVCGGETLTCYRISRENCINYIFVDKQDNVKSVFTNSRYDKQDSWKVSCALSAALTGKNIYEAKKTIGNVFSFDDNKFIADSYYETGYVYDCVDESGLIRFATTFVDEEVYNSGVFWTPQELYSENAGNTNNTKEVEQKTGNGENTTTEIANKVQIEDYLGTWYGVGGRWGIEISKKGNQIVARYWGSGGASSGEEGEMICEIADGRLNFHDGRATEYRYDDYGNKAEMERYSNASGFFYIEKDDSARFIEGELYCGTLAKEWDGYTDDAKGIGGYLIWNMYNDDSISPYYEYVIWYSSQCYLSETEVKFLSDEERRIARNEIYARHGRKFKDQGLRDYFNSKSWYHGTIEPDSFDESCFNEFEKKNIQMLQ
ncbi:MAG: YARHG domain-containing protein [Eubacteriales bacterium]|nr:YARHG domain-containing protein [Eubacteriales bacterium]